jgi:putative ABC transport system substrate-binding protein
MAWPLATRAQQAMPTIGFLASQLPDAITDRLRGFRQGLKDTGYVEGENVSIVYRFAENQDERLPALAAELVSRRVAVIATAGLPPTFAAKAATTTIPVVFLVGDDPARLGLVTNLSRPGGNNHGSQYSHFRAGGKAAGTSAYAGTAGCSRRCACQSGKCRGHRDSIERYWCGCSCCRTANSDLQRQHQR